MMKDEGRHRLTFTQGKLTNIKTGSRTRKQENSLCCSGSPKIQMSLSDVKAISFQDNPLPALE